jgi:hypothetical protein
MAGHVTRMGEKRNASRILVGKPLRSSRCMCVDNIKMDLREIGWVVWIRLIWFRIGTNGWLL